MILRTSKFHFDYGKPRLPRAFGPPARRINSISCLSMDYWQCGDATNADFHTGRFADTTVRKVRPSRDKAISASQQLLVDSTKTSKTKRAQHLIDRLAGAQNPYVAEAEQINKEISKKRQQQEVDQRALKQQVLRETKVFISIAFQKSHPQFRVHEPYTRVDSTPAADIMLVESRSLKLHAFILGCLIGLHQIDSTKDRADTWIAASDKLICCRSKKR